MTYHRPLRPAIRNVSRRNFLAGAGAGSLVLSVGLPVWAQEKKFAGAGMPNGLREDVKIFVAIADDGTVTITCHRSEMGQGIRTSLPMVVADELEADWAKVKVAQAPGDEARFGNQDTDGSRSMRHHFMTLRRMGAAARAMLIQAAATSWGVPAQQVEAVNHELVHRASNRKIGYGAVAKAAAALPVPGNVKLKDPAQFRYIGKGQIGLIDGMDITTGRAGFGIDTRLDGMLYAVVARPPVYGGKVASFDAAEAMKVKGVLKVVQLDTTPPPSEFGPLGGVAVVASNTWAAIKGREALKITWDNGANAAYSSDSYKAALEASVRKPGKVVRNQGDAEAALASAAKRIEAEYYVPHLAQAPMEPPAAVVRVRDGACEAWACTQSPQAARIRLAKFLGIPAEKVTVHVTMLGGGFGRKSKPDYVVEAGLLSKAMDGAPVKVTWTREDDLRNGFLHTVTMQRLEAGLDASGKLVAWRHRSAFPSIASLFAPNVKVPFAIELGMGLVNLPFDIPNIRAETPEAESHARIGWYRSVANIQHAFAIQSFVTEIAQALGKDPKDYLLELIGPARKINPTSVGDVWNHGEDPAVYQIDTGRLRGVIEAVAKGANWGRSMAKGHGLGIAAHYSFVSYIAVVAEVQADDKGGISIPRIDIAIDCGPQINPERIRAQMEGGVIMGVSNAMLSELTFKDGRVVQSNYDGYEVARMDSAPREVHVHLVPASDYTLPLGGVGEPGVPPVGPALANAIAAATGKRIRQLPMRRRLAG
ncbi:MAG: xanthine dehydrogenase family protein molybdopterin-binding subunit [Alphaproteobacteria bacterium]|nr:xanthine dehydrogenase family protein molybdopterin-binding subunit [Alphaproteobacteria bacterium]